MGKTTIEAYQCDRCSHAWIPRLKVAEEPALCPKCKSAYWNKPRRTDIHNELEQARELMKMKKSRKIGDEDS